MTYELALVFDEIEESETADDSFHLCMPFEATFDFNFPYRPVLEFIRDRLRETSGSAQLYLPEYVEFEDFIVGAMHLPNCRIGIYFEHSLSYVSFSSCRRENLKLLISAVDGLIFSHPGYQLSDAG